MPLSAEQRHRVFDAIRDGRLRLDSPTQMFAGYGTGRECAACGELIDPSQVEYEALYPDGQVYRVHLGCAGLWDAERCRWQRAQTAARDE